METRMAAIARPSEPVEYEYSQPPAVETANPVARLALLHAEASETARLANLLGRSIYVAVTLAAGAALVIALADADMAKSAAWGVMVAVSTGVLWRVYTRTMRAPFQRPSLKSFARDVSAILLYAGFAWGAGAFLVLPSGAGIGPTVLFAAGTGAAVAVLLREREAVFLFLAPVAAMTAFACVLRPLPGGALDAALVLIGCALVAFGVIAAERISARSRALPQLA
jgi:hypothetical protein